MQSLASPGLAVRLAVHEQTEGPQTHTKLWKSVLANQDRICEMVQFRVDHMTMERVYIKLRDLCINRVRVIYRNVFWQSRPIGGAIAGPCGIFGAEVHRWHPGGVCIKSGMDRANGTRD